MIQGWIEDPARGGGIIGLQEGGGAGGGPTLDPMLKSLQRGPNKNKI